MWYILIVNSCLFLDESKRVFFSLSLTLSVSLFYLSLSQIFKKMISIDAYDFVTTQLCFPHLYVFNVTLISMIKSITHLDNHSVQQILFSVCRIFQIYLIIYLKTHTAIDLDKKEASLYSVYIMCLSSNFLSFLLLTQR